MKLLAVLASATAASAAAVVPVAPRDDTVLYPHRTYRRWVQTGEMINDPQDQPLVVKNGNPDDETTTIVSFKFDEDTEGKECQLFFKLWADRDTSEGSETMDVFTYNNLPSDVSTFADVMERDIHVGRISVPLGEEAEWKDAYHGWPKIPCPAGKIIGVEYVGAGDEIEVQWDIGVSGPTFHVLEE